MTNPNQTIITIEAYNVVVRDLVKTEAECERLRGEMISIYDDGRCPLWICQRIEAALELADRRPIDDHLDRP